LGWGNCIHPLQGQVPVTGSGSDLANGGVCVWWQGPPLTSSRLCGELRSGCGPRGLWQGTGVFGLLSEDWKVGAEEDGDQRQKASKKTSGEEPWRRQKRGLAPSTADPCELISSRG